LSDEERARSNERQARHRDSRVPVLPVPRHLLPWILGALSAVLIALGLLFDERGATLLGVVGLFATVVAFPLARVLLGDGDEDA
jgi:Zn-dependent membrane protease YugP